MKDAGLPVTAKIIITTMQQHDYQETIAQITNLEIPLEVSSHVMPAMDGDTYPLQYRVSSNYLLQLMQEILINFGGTHKTCTAGTAKLRINPEGFVHACELIREPLGNIRENTLHEMLNSKTNHEIKTQISNYHNTETYSKVWAIPCAAISKIEHNNWQQPAAEAIRWTQLANQLISTLERHHTTSAKVLDQDND